MLTYEHVYNFADPETPFNQCIIDSEASNIALYVNDIFKTTLTPNNYKGLGSPINLITYKALDINIDTTVALLAKGTIEANEYSLLDRKSIFNDKNYCVIKKLVPVDKKLVGGLTFETAVELEVNKKYLSLWYGSAGYYSADNQYDFYKFTIPLSGYYTITVEQYYWYSDIEIYNSSGGYVASAYAYYSSPNKKLYLAAGATYVVKARCVGSYSTQAEYSIKILADGATLQGEVDLKADLIKYLVIENGKLVLSSKASKFYFNPKYFNLPQLYLKLYGAVPSDKDINYHYSDSQQLSMINSKVISFSNTESLPIDIDINTFDTTLDSNRFRTTGGSYSLSIDNLISLDDYAKIGDIIKLVSGTERIEFTYSPYTTTTYIEPNNIAVTSARIFHYPVTFYNPNKKVLFSFPLNKGINNLAISKTIGSITYNKSLQVTRT